MGIKSGLSLETSAGCWPRVGTQLQRPRVTLPKFVKGELKTNFTLGLMHRTCGWRPSSQRQRIANAGL